MSINVPDLVPVYYRPFAIEGVKWDGEQGSGYAIMAWLTQHNQTPHIERDFPGIHILWKDIYTNESMRLSTDDWLLIDPTSHATYVRKEADSKRVLLFVSDMNQTELDVFSKLKKGGKDA